MRADTGRAAALPPPTDQPPAAVGWIHVDELSYNAYGLLVSFAATYELNCQYVGGQPGFEGSLAYNASAPMLPVPPAPETPGPVTGLAASNHGPTHAEETSTTLTWTNPPGYGDVDLDMVASTSASTMPALLGVSASPYGRFSARQYLGTASSYHADYVDAQNTGTYRVVPRGPSGRLGPPRFVTVLGTRLSIPDDIRNQTVTIGRPVTITGRLTVAWDYVKTSDVMNGPPLAGKTVTICRQERADYFNDKCKPLAKTTTGSDGSFSISATPLENSRFTLIVPATSEILGNLDLLLQTDVAPRTDLRSPDAVATDDTAARTAVWSGRLSGRSVPRGSAIPFTTSASRVGSRGLVLLQRLVGRHWRTVRTSDLVGARGRRLALSYRESKPGLHAYRVVKPGDAHHVAGHSRVIYVRVR